MFLFLFLVAVFGFESQTPVTWRDCKGSEGNSVTTFRRAMPSSFPHGYHVDIQDIHVNSKKIPKGDTLACLIRAKLLKGVLRNPEAHVQIRRKRDDAFIANINFHSLCGKISCPANPGDYAEFELSKKIPRIINLFLEGEKTEFTVVAVVSESTHKVGCVVFDIVVTQ